MELIFDMLFSGIRQNFKDALMQNKLTFDWNSHFYTKCYLLPNGSRLAISIINYSLFI